MDTLLKLEEFRQKRQEVLTNARGVRNLVMLVVFLIGVFLLFYILYRSSNPIVTAGVLTFGNQKPVVKKYQYVRVWRRFNETSTLVNHPINLAEIEVISQSGENVALQKQVTASSVQPDHLMHALSNFTNGKMNDFVHTDIRDIEWVLVDLGGQFEIKQVILYNRQGEWRKTRAQDSKIQLFETFGDIEKFDSVGDTSNIIQSNSINFEQANQMKFMWSPSDGPMITAGDI